MCWKGWILEVRDRKSYSVHLLQYFCYVCDAFEVLIVKQALVKTSLDVHTSCGETAIHKCSGYKKLYKSIVRIPSMVTLRRIVFTVYLSENLSMFREGEGRGGGGGGGGSLVPRPNASRIASPLRLHWVWARD